MFMFTGIPSLYLRHELGRLKRDPSHLLLFRYRCQGQDSLLWQKLGVGVHGRGTNSIDGVKYFEQLLLDGRKYGAHEVLVPKTLIIIKSVTLHQNIGKTLVHQDLSRYTRPGTRALNGSEIIEVTERGKYWVITLRKGRKRPRESTEECIVVQASQGGGGGKVDLPAFWAIKMKMKCTPT